MPVREAGPASGPLPVPVDGTRHRLRLGSPATALVLGLFGLALVAAWGLLTYLTGDVQASRDGSAPAFAVVCGLVGLLVARRQPRTPEGWLLLAPAVAALAVVDIGLYAVLDYRVHRGLLPPDEAAVLVKDILGPPLILIFPLAVLLFPDGRLTRRWTWVRGPIWPSSRRPRRVSSPVRPAR